MWHDPETNLLVYETQDARVLKFTEGAKPVDGKYIALPASLRNLQVMRLLGFPVIRPLENYDWPRSRAIAKPFHAQVETANFLAVHNHCCCLSDMGTGKTLASLWAADAMMRDAEARGEPFRALIVAPLNTLHTVWNDAIFQHFMGRRKAVIVHGTPEKRLEQLAKPVDFYLLNHDGIKVGARRDGKAVEFEGFANALIERTDIKLVIVDEVGAFRDYKTLRSIVARTILAAKDYLWLMTGTPTPQGPLGAYGLGMLLNRCRGETFTHFRQRIMYKLDQWKWEPRAGANEAAQQLLVPSIRFSIDDCMDLPELTTQTRAVELTPVQEKLINELVRELAVVMASGGIVEAVHEAAKRIKLIQIACGMVYDDDHTSHYVDCQPRIRELIEIIEEAGTKVIVFAPFTSVVKMLNEKLKGFSKKMILGETPVKERIKILTSFQSERDPHVLIAQPETVSHGQTLTAAATTVWYGPCDKTDTYIQANKRMHRPGQTRPCAIVNLAGTKIERETYRRLLNNERLQGLLLGMVRDQSI